MTKESLYQGRIFKDYLLNQEYLDSEEGQRTLNEHMLLGWLANKQEIQDSTLQPIAKKEFKRQWHLNQTYQEILVELAPKFVEANIRPVLLKGITFLDKMYKDLGDRSMSDIDMFVNPNELNTCVLLLESAGFTKSSSQKWRANSHKLELIRTSEGIETVIELHTKLFYHVEEPKWNFKCFSIEPYLKLESEDEFLYLCTHVGFQHSFMKLFWLLDLHFILSGLTNIDEKKVINLAKAHKVYSSFSMTLYILKTYFGTELNTEFNQVQEKLSGLKKSLLSVSYLMNPKSSMLQYLSIKHLCKDSFSEAINYNLGWIKDRFSS